MGFGYVLGRLVGKLLPKKAIHPLAMDSRELAKLFQRTDGLEIYQAAEEARSHAGEVDGCHYTTLVPNIKAALKAKDLDAAAGLLLRAVEAVESEGQHRVRHEAPVWYHERLATVYKKLGRPDLEEAMQRRMAALPTGEAPRA